MFGDDRVQCARQFRQPGRQRQVRLGPDLAVGKVRQAVTFGPDDPPTGRGQGRIEAEDDQASFSITSSLIS
jgi:hypothetical protein